MLEMSAFKLFMVAPQLIILNYPVMLLTSFTILSYCLFPFEVYNSNKSCQICKVKLDMLFASFMTLIKNDFHETFLA